MADATIIGTFPGEGEQFQFNVNGLATQKQMEKLIQLTEAMAKRIKADLDTGSKRNKAEKEHLDNLEDLNEDQKKQIKQNKEFKAAWEDLLDVSDKLTHGWKYAAKSLGGSTSQIAFATSFLIGSLTGYADSLAGAMKMGVSGEIMDFAVAAKTAGVSMGSFTKALSETGGGFASLGTGATDGAKNFAALVSNVRSATASVGNLGMTNEELATFTAQQTKLAVSQGFKGRQAQDLVIKNSQYLGKELDDLANRTGKNVLEMAAAAAKLASDPIVTTFVKSAQAGGAAVSKAVQSFGASLNAQFGEAGGQLGADALKSALGGLPFAITQSGKNMILASQTTYAEIERQAQKAKRGEEITAADRERLNKTVLQEVEARGDQLRMMANLEGPAGESARQLLSMAKEAEFYNSEEGRKRREQDKTAQQFNASIRQFQANLQALAVPFLELINGINWTLFIDIVSGATKALELLLTPLKWMGQLLGDTGVGTVIGGILGFVGVLAFVKTGLDVFSKIIKSTSGTLSTFKNWMETTVKPGLTGKGVGFPDAAGGATIKDGSKNVNQTLERFASTAKFAAAALGGLALSTWGAARLKDDENDLLGKVLVGLGSFTEVVGTWGALFTGLFPQLASKVGMLITGFSEFIGLSGLLSKAWTLITAAATGLFPALSSLAVAAWTAAAPFLPLIAAVTAVVGIGYLLYKNWDSIVSAGKELWNFMSTFAGKIWDAITSPFKWFSDWLKNSWLGKMFGGGDSKKTTGDDKSTVTGMKNPDGSPMTQGQMKASMDRVAPISGGKNDPNKYYNNLSPEQRKATDDAIVAQAKFAATTTGEPKPGYTKDLSATQAGAIDQNKVKEAESAKLQRQQISLLEELNSTNSAQLGVQSRTAGAQDNSNRYLKTLSLSGNA